MIILPLFPPVQPLVAEIPAKLDGKKPVGLVGWNHPEGPEERKASDMTLGERIQTYRKRAGLSQEALAEQLGISRQAVSKWEVDAAQPELDKVVALARVFGITTDELLLGEIPDPQPVEGGAPGSKPPRWYLLGIIPLALGAWMLVRGIMGLITMISFLQMTQLPLG